MALGAISRAAKQATLEPGYAALTRAIGGAAGGGAFYASSDEDLTGDEKLLRTLGGAALGGLALPGLTRALSVATTGPDRLTNAMYYNYLSSPDTIARANLGALGGTFTHLIEEMALGNWNNAGRLLDGISEGAITYGQVLKGDQNQVRAIRKRILGDEYRFDTPEDFRDIGLGKWYTAGDIAAVTALKRSGLSTGEAMKLTLTGTPETQVGQWIVNAQSAMLRGDSYFGRLVAAGAAPFARVGVVGMEQGLKRTPGIGMMMQHGTDPLAKKRMMIRQGAGVAAIGAGMLSENQDWIDPRLSQTMGTLAGPGFLPFSMGRGAMRRIRSQPTSALSLAPEFMTGMSQGAMEFAPLGMNPMGLFTNTANEIPRRFIPAAVSDVAEALDPEFGRISSRDQLRERARQGLTPNWMAGLGVGTAMSRIPGLRERLPVDYSPVGPEGQQLYRNREALPFVGAESNALMRGLSRVMAPTRQQSRPPTTSMLDPQEAFMYDLGITRGAPSQRGNLMGMRFDPSSQAAPQMAQLRGLGPQIGRQMMQGPMGAQLQQMAQTNPALAQWLARRMYQTVTSGVGQGTGLAANIAGLQGSGFGGFGG